MYSCVPSSLLVPLAKRVPHQDPPCMESVQGMLPDRHLPKFKIRVIKMEDW